MADGPGDLRCPVWGCRAGGVRWVVLYEYWRLAPCAEHADDVEAHPELWRLVSARPDGVLRIARTGEAAPGEWNDEPREAKR